MASKPAKKLPRGIDRRTDGMFRARVTWRGHQYSIGSFWTIGDARAALEIARSEIARQVFIPPAEQRRTIRDEEQLARLNALTVKEWSEDWLKRLESLDKAEGTLRSYRSTLKVHVLEKLGRRQLVSITPAEIDELIDEVKARGGPWMNVARTVRAMFRAAVAARAGGLTESPVQVSVPKEARTVERIDGEDIASPADVRAMAAGMPEHLRIAVMLAAWCALRQGEVLGLQRRDFEHLDDPTRTLLHVRRQWNSKATPPGYTAPKSGSVGAVAVPASVVPELARHVERFVAPDPTAPLLPSPRDSRAPISQSAFDRAWRVARDAVRPGFRFHALRHTGLTEYGKAGATLEDLKRRGRHRNIETAMRYQHSTAQRDRELTDRLNATIGDGR
ncbi:tyrosine-type recombinase/integrase [Georgenia sp. Z1344]|uniref:tyrosine-type recombinase/integrase n=1 Tax=Georgenia sp. Z1344 TaxID=3416706 RepID=UPI003CF90000